MLRRRRRRYAGAHATGRGAARLVAAMVLVLAAALVGMPQARASDSDERALAERFAPAVRLVQHAEECGPGEPYRPTDVEAVLGNDGVALRGPWEQDDLVRVAPTGSDLGKGLAGYHLDLPGNPLDPGCDYERWARTATAHTVPTVYAHVATEAGHADRLALQYWFYYPFNDYTNTHESDWEMVQLVFAASDAAQALGQQPLEVAYSQHEGAEVAAWGDPKLTLIDGTHPVVHPAAGSHANFFDAALYLGTSAEQGFGCDDTRAPDEPLRPAVSLLPSDETAARAAYPWIGYEGRWGQREEAFYNGPTGPNTKQSWAAPVTFQEQLGRERSYAVPAGGAFGTAATDFFCGAVATGSTLLRQLVDNPWPTLLVLGLLALLAVALARRTTWRPSTPVRVARRRATGQVLAASARMYRARWALFVGIGAVTIPVSLVVAGLQGWLVSAPTELTESGEGAGLGVLVAALLGYLLLAGSVVLVLAATTRALTEIDAQTDAQTDRDPDGRRPVGVRRAYLLTLQGWRPLAGAFLVASTALALLSLTIVLAVAALVLAVLWSLFVPAAVIEGRGALGALRRSAQLVRHRFLKVAVLLVASVGLTSGAAGCLGALLILATGAPLWVANAVAGIGYAVVTPYVGLVLAYAYADLRVTVALAEPEPEPEQVLPAELA